MPQRILLPRSLGNRSASPAGAVVSTCNTPSPNQMISQSADTSQLFSKGSNW